MVSHPLSSDTAYARLFFDEALDQLAILDRGLVRLEAESTNADLIQALFRAAHTLKGSAATFGLTAVMEIAHAMESVLEGIWHHGLPVTAASDQLLQAFDLLRNLVEARRDTIDEAQRAAVESTAHALQALIHQAVVPQQLQACRAKEKLLPLPEAQLALLIQLEADCAMPAVRAFLILRNLKAMAPVVDVIPSQGEITRGCIDRRLLVILETPLDEDAVRTALKQAGEVQWVRVARGAMAAGMWLEMPSRDSRADAASAMRVRVGAEVLSRLSELSEQLTQGIRVFQQTAKALYDRYPTDAVIQDNRARATQLLEPLGELQALVQQAYQVPVGTMLDRFPRMVRDLCHTLGKDGKLIMTGEGTLVERAILDQLTDPLMHLLRNAVDHGIESPAQRLASGKPATGTIVLTVIREPDTIVIRVQDDGAGIDAARITERAMRLGYLSTAECQALTREERLELLFLAGISTADTVTTVSGRGVGMDVVKKNIEALGGRITLETAFGEGTAFTLTIPAAARRTQDMQSEYAEDSEPYRV